MLKSTRWLPEVTVSLDVFIFIANYDPVKEGSPSLSSLLGLHSNSTDRAECLHGWIPSILHSFIQLTHLR